MALFDDLFLQVDTERKISTGKSGTETVTTFKRTVIKQGYNWKYVARLVFITEMQKGFS